MRELTISMGWKAPLTNDISKPFDKTPLPPTPVSFHWLFKHFNIQENPPTQHFSFTMTPTFCTDIICELSLTTKQKFIKGSLNNHKNVF